MARLDPNRLISRQSSELFQLNALEQHLLAWISSQGENTIYGLEKMAQEHNRKVRERSQHPMKMSHATISRRIKDLLDQGYIEISKEEPYRTGQNKKYYAVSTKGFLASLGSTSIDQTHSFGSLYPIARQLTDNEELAKTTMLFFKLCLSTWFQWHIWNGLPLCQLNDADSYRALSSRVPTIPILGRIFYAECDPKKSSHSYSGDWRRPITEDELLEYLSWNVGTSEASSESKVTFELVRFRLAAGMKLVSLMSQEDSFGLAIIVAFDWNQPDHVLPSIEDLNDPAVRGAFHIAGNEV